MSSEADENLQLPWTGERYLPELEGDIELEHVHRYAIARDLAYGKDVLDIACGEGYGSELLATVARQVTGVDISEEAITHASRKYVRPNLSFAVGSCACIPLPDASVDLVASFETIEHHDQHLEMMKEIRRVLRPDGVLVISSPDKHEYSDVPGYKNEYHVKELYLSEFTDLLASEFRHVNVFGQRVYFGSLAAPIDGSATRFASYSRRNESVRREPGVINPLYYIALASNGALPEIRAGLYEGASYLDSQFEARDVQIASLGQAVAERDAQVASLTQAVAERDAQIASLGQAVAERDAQVASLGQAVAERDAQVASLGRAVAERDAQVASLGQAVAERDAQVASLGQAVAERDAQVASLGQAVAERNRQLAALAQDLAGRKAEIDSLRPSLGEVGRLTTQLRESQAHLNALSGERDSLRKAILDYRSSTSWRITAPLRYSREIASSVFEREWRRFLQNAVGATKAELRRRGPIGFVLRVPYYVRHRHFFVTFLESRPPDVEHAPLASPGTADRLARLHPELSGVGAPIDHSVSVIIPTLNAGREFTWLLRKLRGQKGLKALQIVIVDSGSTDGTVELARAASCTLVQIKPDEFSHSFARNAGAAAASGDFLLFMVQDAYPIGDYWAYGMLRYLLDHVGERVAGVSCSEYCRSDSDMMYDWSINAHYRFLGCLEQDRIYEHRGDDHLSLRSSGQLSNVSCLISRELFELYRFRGDYAEDLDLGIRLLKDGYRVAMLTSVKVVHSHNRPAFYYLKRTFLDVILVLGRFEDFSFRPVGLTKGLVAGIVSTAAHLSDWLARFDASESRKVLHEELDMLITCWRKEFVRPLLGHASRLGDAKLDAYVDGLSKRHLATSTSLDRATEQELQHFVDGFLGRLEHFNTFARNVYLEQDESLRGEMCGVVRKSFAAAVGWSLGFLYLSRKDPANPEHELVEHIRAELQAGI